ncbi:MAG TPA: DUF2993 domain-containing protein [Armatimonadota bacterium]|nr:DUF2993 domain-containing protein [Armatimonadota bacterium]
MRNLLYIVSLLLLIPLLAGCSGKSRQHFAEQQITERAPSLIGPAESYSTHVSGLSSRHVDTVKIVGVGVKPDPNLVIDPLELTISDVSFQQDPFRVLSIGNTQFSARISESALNNYIRQQSHPGTGITSNEHVELLDKRAKVTATVNATGLVNVPVSTTGRIVAEDGLRLIYVPETLVLGNVAIPRIVQVLIAGRINPLADLSGLRFQPRITNIGIRPGELLINGTANLRDLTQQ